MNREADARQVGAQKFPDAERQGLGQLRKHVNRLELLGIDISLARPIVFSASCGVKAIW